MKLISLNAWGGTYFEPLMKFIAEHAPTTDIFCFQEASKTASGATGEHNRARMNLFKDLQAALPNFAGYFAPMQAQYDFHDARFPFKAETGEALFIRTTVPTANIGQQFASLSYNEVIEADGTVDWPAAFQHAQITAGDRKVGIMNFHGISLPGAKLDTPRRLEQSRKIIAFLDELPGEKILCGDFNLMPDTESVKVIERAGMRNLIKEFGITETRGAYAHAKYPHDPQHFADYTFVSPGITVTDFSVQSVLISDHLPMILEFSL